MFAVRGIFRGREVDVRWDDGALKAEDDVVGEIDFLVEDGAEVTATPTGPVFAASLDSLDAAFATVAAVVGVVRAEGDLPDYTAGAPEGVIF